MGRVLHLGCEPDWLVDVLPPDVEGVERAATGELDLILIGPASAQPILMAQRLASEHRGVDLLIVAAPDAVEALAVEIRLVPYVPMRVRVVPDEAAARREAVHGAIATVRLHRAHALAVDAARSALNAAPERSARAPSQAPLDPAAQRFGAAEQACLVAFLEAYEPHRPEIARSLRDAFANDPVFGPIAALATPEQTALRDERSAALQRAAILEGAWEPYLADLAAQGQGFAQLGLAFQDWPRVLSAFRSQLHKHLAIEEESLWQRVSIGMDLFLDAAMGAIGGGYVDAREELLARHAERERLFISVVESSTDAILTQALGGTVLSWNPAAERLYGWAAEEVIGQSMERIVPEEHRAELAAVHARLSRGERVAPFETVRVTKSGARLDVSLTLSALTDASGRVVATAGIARDITAQRASRAAIAESEARKAAMLGGALDSIITLDHGGRVLEMNPAAVALFGYSDEESRGQLISELIIPPAGRAAHQAGLARYVATRVPTILGRRVELTAMKKGGAQIPVEVSVVRLGDAEPPLFTGFIRDLSEIKRVEQELVARAEELARSNAELEQFAHVASHDLQEPLRMIASYVALLEERYRGQLDERADRYIHYAVDGAKRMQQLIDDVLKFSRVSSRGRELQPVELESVARDVLTDLSVAIDERAAKVDVGPLPAVVGDASQLRQLFQNLIGNALKFAGDAAPHVQVEAVRDGATCVVTVKDNGIGIAPKHFERIFGVFERLHGREEYPGSGIGLAVSKKIVERHRGAIWVESQEGEGTTFFVRLVAA